MKQNSNKKRKFTFNAIDALIILLIVALIALTVYFFVLGKDFGDSNEQEQENQTNEEAQATASVSPIVELQKEVYLA